MVPAVVSPALAIVLLVAANAVTAGLMLLVRRRAPEGNYFHDTTQASGVFTVAGTAYAVLLAFVFLLAFQSYNSARSAAEAEATATASLYHDADAFQAPIAARLHGEVVCYARALIPGLVWVLLGVGSGLVVIYVLFFADRRERGIVQAMLMVSVTTMLGAGQFFDDPYQNVPGSIRPEAMACRLATLESTRVEEGTRAPCGLEGLPLRRAS